jgi:AAA family ATP:ADP antiporter
MSAIAEESPFNKVRSLFWPIHRSELKKFIPMLLIYALIVFNYTLLKGLKDALVVTASGAESLPFIKIWAIFPMAVLFTYLFTKLSNRFNREKVFYIMMSVFLVFFFLFGFILYPFKAFLHPDQLANQLQTSLPAGFKGLIMIIKNWSFTLFYVMSELWGAMIMSVLFWGFANEVSSVKDAKRFYAILGVGANISTVFAGQLSVYLSKPTWTLFRLYKNDPWGESLAVTSMIVVLVGFTAVIIYRWMTKHVFKKCPEGFDKEHEKEELKKQKMSFTKHFTYLANSKYLIYIAIIVLTYNISLNMVEVVWKDQIKNLFPNPSDYFAYMGNVNTSIGIISTIVGLFICGTVIRRAGWTIGALVTPVMLLITSILFFSFVFFKDTKLASFAYFLGATPLTLAVFFGSLQNSLSRACKFTFFDTTKEMSFIPLSKESKLKGKAAIDGVGSRLGKTGGSLVHQLLLIVYGSVSTSTPIVAIILFAVVIAWIFAVRALGVQFDALTKSEEAKVFADQPKEAVTNV